MLNSLKLGLRPKSWQILSNSSGSNPNFDAVSAFVSFKLSMLILRALVVNLYKVNKLLCAKVIYLLAIFMANSINKINTCL